MKISFKKINKALLVVQISALMVALFMIVRALRALFTILTGANAL
jgi:hypothetical protein